MSKNGNEMNLYVLPMYATIVKEIDYPKKKTMN